MKSVLVVYLRDNQLPHLKKIYTKEDTEYKYFRYDESTDCLRGAAFDDVMYHQTAMVLPPETLKFIKTRLKVDTMKVVMGGSAPEVPPETHPEEKPTEEVKPKRKPRKKKVVTDDQ